MPKTDKAFAERCRLRNKMDKKLINDIALSMLSKTALRVLAVEVLERESDACNRIEQLIEALNPIREWYGGGTEGDRSDLEILTNAIADLQIDREKVLEQATKIEEQNKELEKHHWIPVSERLPENDHEKIDIVAAQTLKSGKKTIKRLTDTKWLLTKIFPDSIKITHWKPIVLPDQALKSKPEGE